MGLLSLVIASSIECIYPAFLQPQKSYGGRELLMVHTTIGHIVLFPMLGHVHIHMWLNMRMCVINLSAPPSL